MEINNQIRRTKSKLDLFEQEGFNWFLTDLAQELDVDDIFDGAEALKKSYLQYIKDNKKETKQSEIKF